MAVEIVTIGTELLLGHLVDTNSTHVASVLADAGVDVYYKHSVGDNAARLEALLREKDWNAALKYWETLQSDDGAHFDFAFPPGPVLAMQLEEPGAAFKRRFLIGILENCVAADHFFGFRERAIGDANFSGGETHSGACVRAAQLAACD